MFFVPRTEFNTLDVVPEHGLHLYLHSELRDGTRSVSGDDFRFSQVSMLDLSPTPRASYVPPLSWSHRRPAHRDLQPDCSARRLHDCRLYDVDQPLHHWHGLPLFSGQSVFLATSN